jgi:soluble lytic murein transglycosylase-like protein
MFDDRIGGMQKMLARMEPEDRQKYAADNADDPIAVSMALFVNNIAKEIKEGKRGEPNMPPPVVQPAIQSMTQPRMPQGGPPQGMPPQGMPPQGMPPQVPPQGMQPQGPQPAMQPPQGPTQMAADGGYMDSRLPEDMGIGALPERSLSNMADGGIVGYADKGKVVGDYEQQIRDEAERQGVDPELMVRMFATESGGNPNAVSPKGAAGLGQLMTDAAKDMGLTPQDRFNPAKNIPASVGYFKKQLGTFGDPEKAAAAYNWGPESMRRHLAKNPENWKIGLPKETANYLTRLMPVGSAQAAPAQAAPAQAAPAPAEDAPSIYSGPGFTPEGLEALGQRLDVIKEARSKAKPVGLRERNADPDAAKRFEALQNLNKQSQQEYERYAAGLGLDKPAFAAQSAGGKGVGTTTLPQVQAVARAAAAAPAPKDEADTDQSETIAYQGKSGNADQDIGPLTPAIKKEAVALAKAEIPKEERKGFGYEDLMMFGLQMMAGKSQYALQNVGEAGVAALSAKQAREKTEYDRRKTDAEIKGSEALTRKYGAEAQRLEAEDRPAAQMRKELAAAYAKIEADPFMKLDPIKKAAAKRLADAEIGARYAELVGTIGGSEFQVLGSRPPP